MRKLNKIITTAAMVAAILAGTAPKAAACSYTVGPLGRYIVPAQVQSMTADGDGVQVWCSDLGDGDDWFLPLTPTPICTSSTACSWSLMQTAHLMILAMIE